MKTTTKTLLTTALALALAVPAAILAKGPGGPHGEPGFGPGDGPEDGPGVERALDQLDLTDGQRDRLKAIRLQGREQRVEQRIAMLEVLTPEQRATLKERREARQADRQERFDGTKQRFGGGPQGPGDQGRGGGRFDRLRDRMADRLDLTEEQQTQAKSLMESQHSAAEPLREHQRQLADELGALWDAERPSKKAILAKMAEMDAVREQLHSLRESGRESFEKLLTPEQRDEMADMREHAGDRFRQGRGRWQ